MYRFLLTRRWIAFALFALVLAAVCVRLGFWQYSRWEHKLASNDEVRQLLRDKPHDLVGLHPSREWTAIRATGTYRGKEQVTVKFAVRDSQPGIEVITPLELADGSAILVNRGWMPSDNTGQRPTGVPKAPRGSVTVEGWWHPDNGADRQATTPIDGQVRAVSSHGMASHVGPTLRAGYLTLTDQEPAPPARLSAAVPPDLGQGPHFWYAIQWWFFAGLAVVGLGWFARNEAHHPTSPVGTTG